MKSRHTHKILGPEFFDRTALTVAKELLGKYLVRKVGRREIALIITETEAYNGFKDKASHASRGQTPRNTPMFGNACTIYVYFTYGMHWMLNIVCGKQGYPAAVLIRAVAERKQPKTSIAQADGPSIAIRQQANMRARRGFVFAKPLNGPAKLTKFLQIDKTLNNKQLGPKTGLWIEDRGVVISPRHITRTPRVGVGYAGEYAKKPWRFVIKLNTNGTFRGAKKPRRRGLRLAGDA